jgi:NTE family protein
MIKGFFTAILLIVLCYSSQGQKVALVLSGGGPKGLAHIGVLKALEENEIPIDYITGTSMGAIVGGLYASGYTPAQIEQFMTSPDFEGWVRGELDEEYIYYFKQPDPDASWISLRFNFDDISGKLKTSLPTNLVSPYQMDFAILEFFAAASARSDYDFDSLFVPFRCVAADIDSHNYVVLEKGQLGNAIRASSTYPFYFKPITIDGKLLFDGGLYNNFPVDVAQEVFKPDLIIGSRATSHFRDPSEDDPLSHIYNMIVNETSYSLPENQGIIIFTNLAGTNVIDFSKNEEYVDSGYVAATRNIGKIKEMVERREPGQNLAERRYDFNKLKPPLIIDSIEINGLNKSQAYYVRMLLQKRSKYMNLTSLKHEFFKLLADNKIKEVFPALVYNPDRGFYTLVLDITPADHFITGFGGNISSSASNAAFASLEYRLLSKIGLSTMVNGYFGRFYSSAKVEARLDFPSAFPYFISLDYTYNHKDYFKNTTYFFEDKTPTFLIQNENHFGLIFGFAATNKGKFTVGGFSGYTLDDYYQNNYFTRLDTADRTRFNFSSASLLFELNSLNNKQLPTGGTFFHISFRYIDGVENTYPGSTSAMNGELTDLKRNWYQFRLVYDNYFKTIRWMKLGFYMELLVSNMPEFSNYTATILRAPSFSPIPEMKTLFLPTYRAPAYVAGGLKVLFNVYRQLYIRTEGYYFQPYQELAAGENNEVIYNVPWTRQSFAGSAALEYHTRFGPVSLAMNYYDRADDKLTVMFNIGFLIFNKSAFEY